VGEIIIKGNATIPDKPKIEDVILEILKNSVKETALDFVAICVKIKCRPAMQGMQKHEMPSAKVESFVK